MKLTCNCGNDWWHAVELNQFRVTKKLFSVDSLYPGLALASKRILICSECGLQIADLSDLKTQVDETAEYVIVGNSVSSVQKNPHVKAYGLKPRQIQKLVSTGVHDCGDGKIIVTTKWLEENLDQRRTRRESENSNRD